MKNYCSKILIVVLTIVLLATTSFAEQFSGNSENKALVDDFFSKFDLYWVDTNFVIHRNDLELPTTTTDNYSREALFTDGTYLETNIIANRKGGNGIGLGYRGNKFVSYDGEYLADGDSIYYQKCLKEQFDASRKRNTCIQFGLYRNSHEIDRMDYHDAVGSAPFNLLFIKSELLYYEKVTEKNSVETLRFDVSAGKSIPFMPDLFDPNSSNDLIGILPNDNIIYSASSGNTLQANFDVKLSFYDVLSKKSEVTIDLGNTYGMRDGLIVGDHYWFRTGIGPTSLLEDDVQVAQQNSKTFGRFIDASKVACNLDAIIHTYLTKMICIHPSGIVVRIDSASAEIGTQLGGNDSPDNSPELFVKDRPLDLNSIRYLLADKNSGRTLEQVSVAFDDTGQVEFMLFWIHGNAPWTDNIYVARYTTDTGLGIPMLLKDKAQLFGVLAKKR